MLSEKKDIQGDFTYLEISLKSGWGYGWEWTHRF